MVIKCEPVVQFALFCRLVDVNVRELINMDIISTNKENGKS